MFQQKVNQRRKQKQKDQLMHIPEGVEIAVIQQSIQQCVEGKRNHAFTDSPGNQRQAAADKITEIIQPVPEKIRHKHTPGPGFPLAKKLSPVKIPVKQIG